MEERGASASFGDEAAKICVRIAKQGKPQWCSVVGHLIDRLERGPRNTPMVYSFRALRTLMFENPPESGIFTEGDVNAIVDLAKGALGR